MKYTQFLELSNLMESKNITLDELHKMPSLFEAEGDENPAEDEDKIETKSAWKDVLAPKKAMMRKSLNTHAKKLQDGINKDVAKKFIPPLVQSKVKVYQKMAEVGKGKQPKEIVSALKNDLQNIKKIQEKQVGLIEKAAQTTIDNYTKKIESALQKKGLKDQALADLQSYWTLLTTQIMNNLLKKLAKLDDDAVDKTIKDKGILNAARVINKQLAKGMNAKLIEKDKQISELKGKLKDKVEAEDKAAKEAPAEEKKEETKKEA